jgi:hypothetical protein
MGGVRIDRLAYEGLTARDAEYRLDTGVAVWLGPNGAGKTSVHQALHLLAHGRPRKSPGLAATSAGVVLLARDRATLSVEADVAVDQRVTRWRREWSRRTGRGGKDTVTETVYADGRRVPNGGALLGALLSGYAEAWDPSSLLGGAGVSGLRARLLDAIRPASLRIEDVVPDGCPAEYQPKASGREEDPVGWLTSVLAKLGAEIVQARRARDAALDRASEDGDAAAAGPEDVERALAEIEAARRAVVEAQAWEQTERRRRVLGEKLRQKSALAEGTPAPAESAGEIWSSLSGLEIRRAVLAKAADVDEDTDVLSTCPHCKGSLVEAVREARESAAAEASVLELVLASERRRHAAASVAALEAELAALPVAPPSPLTVSEAEARVRALEVRLVAAAGRSQAAEARELARLEAQDAEREIARLEALAERIRVSQRAALASVKGEVEARLSALAGAPVAVDLVDAQGREACRLRLGEVDAATLSDGEGVRFVAALVRVLGERSPARYRPLLLDRIESVSAAARPGFLAAIVEAVRAGALDQAWISGCPDTWVDVPGVQVFHVAVSEVAR